MKKIKLLLLVVLVANLLFCTVFCQVQKQQDTIRVMLLMSDTLKTKIILCCREDTLNDNLGGITIMRTQYSKNDYSTNVYWKFGYVVREEHNTNEGQILKDWLNQFYLDDKKQLLSPAIIVWNYTICNK